MNEVIIGTNPPSVGDVVAVAREGCQVKIHDDAEKRMRLGREHVQRLIDEQAVVYGVTTGFGRFSDSHISPELSEQLQRNLVRSHAVALGEPLDEEVVRAAMFLRAVALARGHSGVRPDIVQLLVSMLNNEVHPCVPQQGSLGASGDLAPLAHIALVLMGEGEAVMKGRRLSGTEALRSAGLEPLTLRAKEGLALINGTQVMTALGVLAWTDAGHLYRSANIIASLSLESLRGIRQAFDDRIARLRGHPGHYEVADSIRKLTSGSDFMTCQGELRVQDPYSLRCIPQVHGAVSDGLTYIGDVLRQEIFAVTDNPLLFFESQEVLSGGNFHGEPVAVVCDHLALLLAELGNMSERRTERMLNPAYNEGLPAFLTPKGGLNSGLMIAHYTAASLAAENKLLANPSSADSIPSSAGQEDHVSLGTTGARRVRQAVFNLSRILAVEALAAAQAVDLRREQLQQVEKKDSWRLGSGTEPAYRWIRNLSRRLIDDRCLSDEVEKVAENLRAGQLVYACGSME